MGVEDPLIIVAVTSTSRALVECVFKKNRALYIHTSGSFLLIAYVTNLGFQINQ